MRCGLGVVTELLRRRRAFNYLAKSDPEQLSPVITAVSKRLPDCKALLEDGSALAPVRYCFGTLSPPFGTARQSVLELVEALVRTNSAFVFNALQRSGLCATMLDMFFCYKWNTLVHQSVLNTLSALLLSPHADIVRHLLDDCKVVDCVLAAERENEEEYSRTHASLGFVAQLTKLSTLLCSLSQRFDFAAASTCDRSDWAEYQRSTLTPRSQRESVKLSGKPLATQLKAESISSVQSKSEQVESDLRSLSLAPEE